jgi:hypothetical protein
MKNSLFTRIAEDNVRNPLFPSTMECTYEGHTFKFSGDRKFQTTVGEKKVLGYPAIMDGATSVVAYCEGGGKNKRVIGFVPWDDFCATMYNTLAVIRSN